MDAYLGGHMHSQLCGDFDLLPRQCQTPLRMSPCLVYFGSNGVIQLATEGE